MRPLHAFATILLAVVLLLCGGGAPQTFAADKIGVVLMHGKTGTAGSRGPLGSLISKLKRPA